MRAKPYLLSPKAVSDLEDLWLYTRKTWSRDQADRYHRSIMAVVGDLTTGRRLGRPVTEREGYLKCAVGSHMIYFRDRGERVEIMRVLHQRQDVDQGMAGEV